MLYKAIQKNKARSANFLLKTKEILSCESYGAIISWDETGTQIKLHNKQEFEKSILPKYFKHSKYSSFLRQLNIYGFRCVSNSEGPMLFYHEKFNREAQNLQYFKRYYSRPQAARAPENGEDNLLKEHEKLKSQVLQLKNELVTIQNQMTEAILKQVELRKFVVNLLKNFVQVKRGGMRRFQKFVRFLRALLTAMNPDSQQTFYSLISILFPSDVNQVDFFPKDLIQNYEFPRPIDPDLLANINGYLSHQSPIPSDFAGFWLVDQDSYSNNYNL